MPEEFQGKSRLSEGVSITEKGILNLPQAVVVKARMQVMNYYSISWIETQPLVILLRENQRFGYRLSYQWKTKQGYSGGKLSLRKFYKQVLIKQVKVPLYGLEAVIIDKWDYDLAIVLEEYPWVSLNFNSANLAQIPSQTYGVYQVLSGGEQILKIGEGMIQERFEKALEAQWVEARQFRYFPIYETSETKKTDGLIYEKILLQSYMDANGGALPPYNKIHK